MKKDRSSPGGKEFKNRGKTTHGDKGRKGPGGKAGSEIATSGGKKKKTGLPHEGNVYQFDEEEEAGGEKRKKHDLKRCVFALCLV